MYCRDSLKKLVINSAEMDHVIKSIEKTHLNGGILVECYKVINEDIFQILYLSNDYQENLEKLLMLPDIKSSVPALNLNEGLQCRPDFKLCHSFSFEYELVCAIYEGGAYKKFDGTTREARTIAANFSDYVFGLGDKLPNIKAFNSFKPWSSWFFDVAWDISWLIFDMEDKKLWLICITDSD
ncbi:hypothetical protein [Mechercharimyces sp. CAU 1602]|uniref:hypothetical protein n=1 Tax=Mechercharimyces sp. CAU 1602 TaxID=2973933 RepID=UPI0021627534|nr:hypothetical protein [Mechercharimyces sp. CAU 1602]MCS1350908.1 hypothetical protein [Mechercharimyces sp. CAU 1602]